MLSFSSQCLYYQDPPLSPPDQAHSDLSSSARIAIIRAVKKLLEHLTDFASTGNASAHAAHGLHLAEVRGWIYELMHVLEATVPLQYEGVDLHFSGVGDVLECRPPLAADHMSDLVSDCPSLM